MFIKGSARPIDVMILAGIPIQFSTDCGSETTKIFALANALR